MKKLKLNVFLSVSLLMLIFGFSNIISAAWDYVKKYGDYTIAYSYGSTNCTLAEYDYSQNTSTELILPDKINDLTLSGIGDKDYYPGDIYSPSFGRTIRTLKSNTVTYVGCSIDAVSLEYAEFDAKKISLGAMTFRNTPNLKKVKGNLDCDSLYYSSGNNPKYYGTFQGCTRLEEVDKLIDDHADEALFKDCNNLKTIYTSAGINKFNYIGANAFENCKALPYIIIGEDLSAAYNKTNSLSSNAFKGWTKDQKIVILANTLNIYVYGNNPSFFNKENVVYGYSNALVKSVTNSSSPGRLLKDFVESEGATFVALDAIVSLNVVNKYTNIGDNTSIELNVIGKTISGNELEIYDVSTNKILHKEILINPLNSGNVEFDKNIIVNMDKLDSRQYDLKARVVSKENFILDGTIIYKKGDTVGTSNEVNINKVNQLGKTHETLQLNNGLPKYIIMDDKTRFYDNNILNQTLVNKINANVTGIYLVNDGDLDPVLKKLLVNN